ncbi:hypothetical protein NFI96_009701 [Prochilodus magdalenae]|nr:hypothetical protein NFI96_009701 [Prochilodus magdalenae]
MVLLGENMTPGIPAQNCTNCSQVLVPELNVTKAVVLGLVLAIFIVFGVLGNILVILSVACHRNLRTVTHYFIVNLAVADLLLSSTVLPFSAVFEMLGRWVFGRTFCDVWAAMDVLCCTASIMSLCVISVDRYIGVSYPLRYPAIVTERRALLALMGVWALSITISVGPLFGWKEPAPEDESICKITEEPGYAIFSAVGSFYLPLVVILVMYCRVYVVARRETRGLRKGQKTEKSDRAEVVTLRIHRGNTAASEDEALRSRTHFALRLLKFSREKKAAKTLGIVVGCFVLCWLPFFLVLPIGTLVDSLRSRIGQTRVARLASDPALHLSEHCALFGVSTEGHVVSREMDREGGVPADGAVGVEVEGHQAFWTCDDKPFISVLTTVPPHTDSLGVSTKTKAGLLEHPHTVPADGAVGVEVEGHQAFWTCDDKPFISVLTTVPPHTDSLGVSTKTKAGLVTEDDPLPF